MIKPPKKKGRISVIIPTYNRKELLEKAIDSVLEQTYSNIEIIVIDDASKDNTDQLIKTKYKNKNIRYFRNEKNLYAGGSRKVGFEKAKGDFLLFLDDDDIFIDKKYFQKAIDLFSKHQQLSFVFPNYIIYFKNSGEDDTTEKRDLGFKEVIDRKKFFVNMGNENYKKPIPSFTIFLKEALLNAKANEMKILNDSTIFLRALMSGPAGFVKDYAGQYLVHGENISFSIKYSFLIENLDEKYKIYKTAHNFFDLSDDQLKEWFIQQLDSTIIYYIKGSKPKIHEFTKLLFWVLKTPKRWKSIFKYIKIYKNSYKENAQI